MFEKLLNLSNQIQRFNSPRVSLANVGWQNLVL